MSQGSKTSVWVRCAAGVAATIAVVTIAAGWRTVRAGDHSIAAFHPESSAVLAMNARKSQPALDNEGSMPSLDGAVGWLNSPPLHSRALRGKVVLVDFWTFTCINSLRPLPYVKAWAAKYKDAGLVMIGVHTPEFSFEKEPANVKTEVHALQVTYPVAIDSNYTIWQAFSNEYWPAQYLIDGKGRIRYHHFGEGDYVEMEHAIQELLKENGATGLDESTVTDAGRGLETPPSEDVESPETYTGYRRTGGFASPERLAGDITMTYSPPVKPSLNQWGLVGSWKVGGESDVLQKAPGKVVFRFHARDLNLVIAPAKDGKPVSFKVRLDGAVPGDNCGTDSAPDGSGEVREPRLYQLIRQKDQIEDRTFEIEFLDPGVEVYDFTFG
jgi:thiol-disulfide isomerase/thioredoxin